MSIIGKIGAGLILVISIILVWINLELYADNFTEKEKREDLVLQLNYLGHELKHANLGERMQHIFPEGFVFTNALYGLAWCEYGIADTAKADRARALSEALYVFSQIHSEKAKSIFKSNIQIENGIYYVGWSNYLLSKIVALDTNFAGSETYKKTFSDQCELIASTLKKSSSPFLQSYVNDSWPADMCVAMASLSNYDRVFKPRYQDLVTKWVEDVRRKLDPKTKLIPHQVDASTGETLEGARGSSISLIVRLLAEIDLKFAREQYKLYKENFVSTTFGLPSVNEYPKGQSGIGDIDSGPVLFGVGFAGTIVSMGTFSALGDHELAENQYKTIHAFGMAWRTSDTKRYVFGQMPVADAFIAWSRSAGLNYNDSLNPASRYWRFKFHFISILILAVLWLPYYAKPVISKLRERQK